MQTVNSNPNQRAKVYLLLLVLLFILPFKGFSKNIRTVYVKKSDDLTKVLSSENTKYIIRYNHDLSKCKNGVVIGDNSTLEFREGSLNNGFIVFNNTKILTKTRRVFSNNSYQGSLNVETAYPEWFGAKGDGITDDTQSIQDAMDVSNYVSGIKGKVYAVRTDTPYQHCLTVKRDSLSLSIDLKDLNVYTTSDYRGRGVIFIDNKNGFSYNGRITSINEILPVSVKTGMSLECGRAGIVCYGDCGGMNINLTCSNLYSGVFHGSFMYDDYLYRNGSVGLNNSIINVRAFRVAYPVALNYANRCAIDVYGDHMHRCVYLCGDYNTVTAQGRNYYGAFAPAHVLLFANVLKSNGQYRIVSSNYNKVTYKQLEGETENIQDGAVFHFQNLRLDLNENIPHAEYSFVGNTVNLYCCKLASNNMQLLYKSFASNWKYDRKVGIDCVFNIYGDISSYLSYASFEFFANTVDKITIYNHTDQQLVYTFAYSGSQQSVYEINGDSRSRAFGTEKYPFCGTLKAKGKNVYVNTTTGNPSITGNIYVDGVNTEVIQNMSHSQHVYVKSK